MLNRLSKVLVVFVATASLAFMGFAFALNNAGPNWQAEAESLDDYTFTFTPGENPTWSGTYRNDSQQVGTDRNLGAVVVKAYADAKRRNDEAAGAITPQIQPLKDRTTAITGFVAQDTVAIDKRHQQLLAEVTAIDEQIKSTGLDGDRFAEQAITIRTETDRRRESVFRLKRELDQIETDQYFQLGQRRRLLDRLHQLEGILLRLRQRHQQLLDAGANPQAVPEA
ncbi:MAG: hypothetical protein ACYTGL_19050 [Planctomycetota bacterium]|jgi:hypothetical protein